MNKLEKSFTDREQLIQHVAEISPWLQDKTASPIEGGRSQAEQQLQDIDPVKY